MKRSGLNAICGHREKPEGASCVAISGPVLPDDIHQVFLSKQPFVTQLSRMLLDAATGSAAEPVTQRYRKPSLPRTQQRTRQGAPDCSAQNPLALITDKLTFHANCGEQFDNPVVQKWRTSF